jgi:hypothetical protein
MQLNKQAKINAALLCATALVGAVLVVRAECGNQGASDNDAEAACHNCTTDVWSTGACTWHQAEVSDAYCGVCLPGYNCTKVGAYAAKLVTTYTNATCGPSGCFGGEPQADPHATPN